MYYGGKENLKIMELRCVYCQSRLKIKSKKNKNNVAFKCPRCKNILLYKDSQILPYNPVKKPDYKPFHYLIVNGRSLLLQENYYGFKIKDGELLQENKDPDFVLQKTPGGYLFINEKKNVSVNNLAAGKKLLSLGDSINKENMRLIYLDGYLFNNEASKERELTSGAETLELNIGNNKEKWKDYAEKKDDESIALNVSRASLIMESDDESITFEINKDEEASIGRGFTDISVMDPRMSKKHAIIKYSKDEGCFIIEDLKSTNGTFVNGNRVENCMSVGDGDIIQIANTYFKFRVF